MLLYELLRGYEQLILYDEIRSKHGTLLYMSATTYTNVSIDENFSEFIVLSNDFGDVLHIHKSMKFETVQLKFSRDRIDIYCENKKIQLFANYFSNVLINEGVV